MLDFPGDAQADKEFRRDDAAGLASLEFFGRVAGVNRRARGAEGRSDGIGELEYLFEVGGTAELAAPTTTRAAFLQVGPVSAAG